MKLQILNIGVVLSKTEQKLIHGKGRSSDCTSQCCCNDDCTDPTTEDDGFGYSVCRQGSCRTIPYN